VSSKRDQSESVVAAGLNSKMTGDGVAQNKSVAIIRRFGSVMKDDWWVEHLEQEDVPLLHEDLEILLQNSRADRRILESLKRTRVVLKKSDDVALPESGAFYDDLHARIMANIEAEEESASATRSAVLTQNVRAKINRLGLSAAFGSGLGTGVLPLMMMMVLVTLAVLRQADRSASAAAGGHIEASVLAAAYAMPREAKIQVSRGSVNVAERLPEGTDASQLLLDPSTEGEFVTDVVASRLDQLPAQDAQALIESLKD
jgi:hypothetical protein